MKFDYVYLSDTEQAILVDILDTVIDYYEKDIADAEKRGVDHDCSKLYRDVLIRILGRIKA